MENEQGPAFLKNLSSKTYSWMQSAPEPPSTSPPAGKTAPVRVPDDASARPIKKPRTKKTTSQDHAVSAASPSVSTSQPHEPPKTEHQPISQPRFKYTTFPIKGFNILPTRNIVSGFSRIDETHFPGKKAGDPSIAPNPEHEWTDTIIIHPGSRNLRIGLASEAFPRTVPHVIARRMHTPVSRRQDDAARPMELDAAPSDKNSQSSTSSSQAKPVEDTDSLDESQDDPLLDLRNELKWRMKSAKRRAVSNAEDQVKSFNTSIAPETIPDHNDPYRVEWTEVPHKDRPDYFVGDKALNLPIHENSDYRLLYPWKYGSLNTQDYESQEAVLGDLQTLWTEAIRSEFDVEDATFENYNAVLVIPDMYHRSNICDLLTMLLRHMKFRGAFVHQEATCATFGAGVSSACVVDIGAQTTTIACLEDGVCLADSRMAIDVGGDDITRMFTSLLLANRFPYADICLARAHDWRLAEDLKEKWCTMNEAEISVQVYDFFVRMPHKPTKKYQCKVYDEVFLAPLCLVYPAILDTNDKIRAKAWTSDNVVDDITVETTKPAAPKPDSEPSDTPGPPSTSTQDMSNTLGSFDVYPIDVAIARSIQAAAGSSDERLKRFFTNIILVGGGGMINNFNRVLEDRILSTAIARVAKVERVEVLPAQRELDPRLLVWKGASVLCKLETAKDMWIGVEEWDQVGAHCLRERALFM